MIIHLNMCGVLPSLQCWAKQILVLAIIITTIEKGTATSVLTNATTTVARTYHATETGLSCGRVSCLWRPSAASPYQPDELFGKKGVHDTLKREYWNYGCWALRSTHTTGFAPGACSRGTLLEPAKPLHEYQGFHGYNPSSGAEFPPHKMPHDIKPINYSGASSEGKLSKHESVPSCVLTSFCCAWIRRQL